MLELFIQQLLSFLEAPLTQMGLSPVAVLRGAELFIIVALTVFGAFFMRRVILVLVERASRTRHRWDDAILLAFQGPARMIVWAVGLTFAAERAAVGLDLAALFPPLRSALVVGILTWAVIRFMNRIQTHILEDATDKLDVTTVEALGRLLRISVLITAGLIILQTLGFSVSGVLAFGGLGGIAVGFAAKDLLSNFFGGLMIFLDRPFGVGDWMHK